MCWIGLGLQLFESELYQKEQIRIERSVKSFHQAPSVAVLNPFLDAAELFHEAVNFIRQPLKDKREGNRIFPEW